LIFILKFALQCNTVPPVAFSIRIYGNVDIEKDRYFLANEKNSATKGSQRIKIGNFLFFLFLLLTVSFQGFAKSLTQFNVGEDCPVFEGLYDFCAR
jgi:hypothetical protein